MDELVRRVGERARELWPPQARVAVAVSGGADSVALLALLHRSRGLHRGVLSVITVDHGLRPDGAEHAAWTVDLATSWGLAARAVRVSCEASEQAARVARYAVLDALDVDRVALAHHRDDQVETVLINLLRGTGPRGLAGMRAIRGRYVRPLLDVPGAGLREWLLAQGLSWREDETNAAPRYLRNRIRHELVPLLEALRPGASAAMAHDARYLAELDAYVSAEARVLGPLPWQLVEPVADAVLRRALLDAVPGALNQHADLVIAAVREGSGTVTLPGGHQLRVHGGRVWVETSGDSGA